MNRLLARTRAGIKPGLEVTRDLLARLGNPERDLRCLHVAGTNGKGSTCRFAHRLLSRAGLATGLFTSPHLVCVRERFVLGEEAISEEEMVDVLSRVLPVAEEIGATFFETLAAAGALWYRERGAEAVVLETGLGGRLDSTTAFPAEVCAVAQVGLDHELLLGDTVDKIWREKIAILRPGKPLVTCQTDSVLLASLRDLARERAGEAVVVDPAERFRLPGLPEGDVQEENLLLAVRACERFLGRAIAREEIASALAGMRWPGRFERVHGLPEVVLDVGHNPDAARKLAGLLVGRKATLLFGAMADKNWQDVLASLAAVCGATHLAPLDTPRAEHPSTMARFRPEAKPHATWDEAWDASRSDALVAGGPLVVAGSFHMVGQAVRRLWADHRYGFWPDGIVPDPEIPGMG